MPHGKTIAPIMVGAHRYHIATKRGEDAPGVFSIDAETDLAGLRAEGRLGLVHWMILLVKDRGGEHEIDGETYRVPDFNRRPGVFHRVDGAYEQFAGTYRLDPAHLLPGTFAVLCDPR